MPCSVIYIDSHKINAQQYTNISAALAGEGCWPLRQTLAATFVCCFGQELGSLASH